MFKKAKLSNSINDSTLVMTALGGDREAFCVIVTKYQNLLCSIAYSSVGDFKHSEDLAQETFVEAWQKLENLHDPEKLKSWLCGILRFKVSHYLRKEGKQPINSAQDITETDFTDAPSTLVEEVAISNQQQTLLWDTLSNIDITYREPLVLFYREQQSVEQVADQLDLSHDTAKQRLSRGRKILKKAMEVLLEEALEKSKPGVAFTAAVTLAIEDVSKHVAAAALGASTVKTTSMLKLGSSLGFLASLSGLASSFFGLKASLYQSRTENEKKLAYKTVGLFLGIALVWVLGMFGLKYFAFGNNEWSKGLAIASQIWLLLFIIVYVALTASMFKWIRDLRAQERIFNPEAFKRKVDQSYKHREYKTKLTLFSVPLIHIQLGTPEKSEQPSVGWIAGGSKAYGLLFAWGGVAIAPISVGIISFGIFTVGAIGFGLLSTGAVALGVIAFGASAVGYKAYASFSSLGWDSAFSNAFSIAKNAAVGPFAYADEVNNELAYQLINFNSFGQTYEWVLMAIAALVVAPSYLYFKMVKRRMSE